jgi:hypothetical protein
MLVTDRRVDRVSLVAGLVVMALGGLLILDQSDVIELSGGMAAALLAAGLGAILVTVGSTEDGA